MSSDTLEVLDANIIIIPEGSLSGTVNALSLFEESGLTSFMRKPLTINQGLSLEVPLGTPIGTYQIESMRSQKVIMLSPLRIEVHDRSGEPDLEKAHLPETMALVADALHIEHIKAIGANWEITFKTSGKIAASVVIAEKLLQRGTSFLPDTIRSVGGSVRLFLADSSREYTLAIEPRGQNAQTDELWMMCNTNTSYPESLSIELLKDMFQQCYHLLFQVKESLFSASEEEEQEWDTLFNTSHVRERLRRLAAEARLQFAAGETEEGGFAVE